MYKQKIELSVVHGSLLDREEHTLLLCSFYYISQFVNLMSVFLISQA